MACPGLRSMRGSSRRGGPALLWAAGQDGGAPTSSLFTWVLSNSRRVSSSRILASCLLTRDLSTMDCSRNSTWLWRAWSWGQGQEEKQELSPEGRAQSLGTRTITMVTRRLREGGMDAQARGKDGAPSQRHAPPSPMLTDFAFWRQREKPRTREGIEM